MASSEASRGEGGRNLGGLPQIRGPSEADPGVLEGFFPRKEATNAARYKKRYSFVLGFFPGGNPHTLGLTSLEPSSFRIDESEL
jgi:hypothetical protein